MKAGTRIGVTLVLILVFFVVLVIGLHAIGYERDAGRISPRAFAVLVVAPMPIVMLAGILFFRSDWARKLITFTDNSRKNSKRGVNLLVWLARFAIVMLVILFLNGLLHIQEKPLAPRLVGMVMNLLFTLAIAVALRRLQHKGSQ